MTAREIPLLLVVDRSALVFLALGVGSIDGDRAALSVGRDHYMSRENNLPTFFGYYMQRPLIDLFH